jgi:hypothetical protein
MKLADIREAVTEGIKGITSTVEQQFNRMFYRMKRTVFRFALALTLFTLSIVFILVGGILIVSKIAPIEWVLFLGGLIMLLVVLLATRFS